MHEFILGLLAEAAFQANNRSAYFDLWYASQGYRVASDMQRWWDEHVAFERKQYLREGSKRRLFIFV